MAMMRSSHPRRREARRAREWNAGLLAARIEDAEAR